MTKILIIALLVAIGHIIQTVTGFGSNVFALAIGAQIYPLNQLVVSLVMVSWIQTVFISLRERRLIRQDILFRNIIPPFAVGMPFGMWMYFYFDASKLRIILGLFIVIASSFELVRLFRGNKSLKPLPFSAGLGILALGGFIHGAFASSGPLIAYYSSRQIDSKGEFRATLAMFWVIIDTILLISYSLGGRITAQTLTLSAYMLPAMLAGIIIGGIIHDRIDELFFKKAVQALLLLSGLFLFR